MSIRQKQPPHPGKVLEREFIKDTCDLIHLSRELCWDYIELENLINGQIDITPTHAKELGRVLNLDPEFWLKLQSDYDASKL